MKINRYFFHVEDGPGEPDHIGLELHDHQAAEQAAIKHAGEILKNEPQRLEDGTLSVIVKDGDETMVCALDIKLRHFD